MESFLPCAFVQSTIWLVKLTPVCGKSENSLTLKPRPLLMLLIIVVGKRGPLKNRMSLNFTQETKECKTLSKNETKKAWKIL